MHKTASVHARMEPKIKIEAESILDHVGLSPAEAIRLLYKQICLHKGLPFDIKIPNKITLKAMKDADARKTTSADSVDDIFEDL